MNLNSNLISFYRSEVLLLGFLIEAKNLGGSLNLFSSAQDWNQARIKRGVQGQTSWRHNFEITDDQKGPPSGSTILVGV